MAANPTRRHARFIQPGMPALWATDPVMIERMALRDEGAAHARPLLERLGASASAQGGAWHLTANRHRDLQTTLAGGSPHLRPGIIEAVDRECARLPTTIEATGLALLRTIGLDVPSCILLAITRDVAEPLSVDGIQLVSEDGDLQAWFTPTREGSNTDPAAPDVHGVRHPRVRRLEITVATLADRAHWCQGRVEVDGLADTVVAVLPGRPLRALLSHPILDPLSLTMTDVGEGIEGHSIGTDYRPRHLPVGEVLDEWR